MRWLLGISLMFSLVSCSPEFASVEHAVTLPVASCGVALRSPPEAPWRVIEVSRDGNISFDGELLAQPEDDPLRILHDRLRAIRVMENARPGFDHTAAPQVGPIIFVADAVAPLDQVIPVLDRLCYRDVDLMNVVLLVSSQDDSEPEGIYLWRPNRKGTQCFAGPATATRLAWTGVASEPGSGADQRVPFFLARVDTYLPVSLKEPPPTYTEVPSRSSAELLPWLRGAASGHGVLLIEPQAPARWQDLVSLLDLAIEAELEQVGDYLLGETIDARDSSD